MLTKHKKRETSLHKKKETDFTASFEDLFDVAHSDALQLIKIPEDRAFLLAQWEKGRRGVMGPADEVLAVRKKQIKDAAQKEQKRRLKAKVYTDQMAKNSTEAITISPLSTSSTIQILKVKKMQ